MSAAIPTMKALLWKDWRLARSLLIATAALYITPTIVGGVWLAIPSNADHPQSMQQWIENAGMGLFIGLIVSLLAAPMFGAVMFARERHDRTAELVGAMPIPRGPIVLSKAIILFILTIVPWLVTAIALFILGAWIRFGLGKQISIEAPEHWTEGLFLPGFAMLAVGTGWLFSSLVHKDTIAAGLSFFVTVFTIATSCAVWMRLYPDSMGVSGSFLAVISWSLGLACFIAGTIIALRRKTP